MGREGAVERFWLACFASQVTGQYFGSPVARDVGEDVGAGPIQDGKILFSREVGARGGVLQDDAVPQVLTVAAPVGADPHGAGVLEDGPVSDRIAGAFGRRTWIAHFKAVQDDFVGSV